MPADVITNRYRLWLGHAMDALAELPDNCVDTCLTDPPYHLTDVGRAHRNRNGTRGANGTTGKHKGGGFMSLKWDGGAIAFDPALWAEVLRVCKPGAFLLSFGGSRTSHRLACAIEDAGWLIRDTIYFLHGAGFPKGLDISKAIDAKAGKKRTRRQATMPGGTPRSGVVGTAYAQDEWSKENKATVLDGTPLTPEAAIWNGWNVALKPAAEPILVCMKPLDGNFATNALKWGTAGLNIDGARVPVNGQRKELFGGAGVGDGPAVNGYGNGLSGSVSVGQTSKGRWPANVILSHTEDCVCVGTRPAKGDNRPGKQGTRPGGFGDVGTGANGSPPSGPLYGDGLAEVWECAEGCPVALLDAQSGESSGQAGGRNVEPSGKMGHSLDLSRYENRHKSGEHFGDSGGASRFFYTAKPRKGERHLGLAEGRENHHPTLKSLALMEYLCTLTATPTGGIVLDPFMGSGVAGMAALVTGRKYLGMELGKDYFALAMERVAWAAMQPIGTTFQRKK